MSDEYNANNQDQNSSGSGYTGNYSGYAGSTGSGNGAGSSNPTGSWSGGTNQAGSNGSYNYNAQDTYQSAYSQSGYSQGGYTTVSGNDGGDGKKKKKKGRGKVVLAVIVALAVGVAGGFGVSQISGNLTGGSSDTGSSGSSGSSAVAEAEDSSSESASDDSSSSSGSSSNIELNRATSSADLSDVTEVVELVMPSVVSVYNTSISTMEYFGQTYSEEETSTGTGFIIAQDDETNELLIVTNNHVVEDADSLEVLFIDDSTATAYIKGTDEGNDLAVISVSMDEMTEDTLSQIAIATLGDSDSLKIGQSVVAIGNALGYGQSVTTGVVSALERELTVENVTGTFIQTDAAINPGNSGGPLVDMNGNVIGINSSKIGGTTVEGMGYAIPISRAIPIIEELMTQTTKIEVDEDDRGYLGISGVSVTSSVASAYNMPEGVYVANLIDGGAAADSELQKGDIITGINGTTVEDMEALQKELTYYAAGETITLTVQRADGSGEYSEMEIEVTLGDYSAIEAYNEAQEAEEEAQSNNRSFGYNNGQ